jgi:hypothetical protein
VERLLLATGSAFKAGLETEDAWKVALVVVVVVVLLLAAAVVVVVVVLAVCTPEAVGVTGGGVEVMTGVGARGVEVMTGVGAGGAEAMPGMGGVLCPCAGALGVCGFWPAGDEYTPRPKAALPCLNVAIAS